MVTGFVMLAVRYIVRRATCEGQDTGDGHSATFPLYKIISGKGFILVARRTAHGTRDAGTTC